MVRLWGPSAGVERARAALEDARVASTAPPARSFSGDVCPICLDEFDDARPSVRLAACSHEFHADCIAATVAVGVGGGGLRCPDDGCKAALVWADFARGASPATLAAVAEVGAARLRRNAGHAAAALQDCVNRACTDMLTPAADAGGGDDAAAQAAAGGATLARCAAEDVVYCLACSVRMGAAVPAHRGVSCKEQREIMRLDAHAAEGEVIALRAALEDSFSVKCPNCGVVWFDTSACPQVTCGVVEDAQHNKGKVPVGGCGTSFFVSAPDKCAATLDALLAVADLDLRRVFAHSIRVLCASYGVNVDELMARIGAGGAGGGAAPHH